MNFKADCYKNAVNKRIIEHHTPTTLSSVKPPFLWCVSGITTKLNFRVNVRADVDFDAELYYNIIRGLFHSLTRGR